MSTQKTAIGTAREKREKTARDVGYGSFSWGAGPESIGPRLIALGVDWGLTPSQAAQRRAGKRGK